MLVAAEILFIVRNWAALSDRPFMRSVEDELSFILPTKILLISVKQVQRVLCAN
jgi:hypothetical protein